jgi:uncharacterized protein YvpB
MKTIKIFQKASYVEIEKQVNEFIADIPDKNLLDIQLQVREEALVVMVTYC